MLVQPISLVLLALFTQLTLSSVEATDFLIAPIVTELQKSTLPENADIYVSVNGNSMVEDKEVNVAAFDRASFLAELQANRVGQNRLNLVCRYQLVDELTSSNRKRINEWLKKLCISAGYEVVSTSEVQTSASWDEGNVDTIGSKLNDHQPEPLVENELVRAYPVRTRLSKFLHGDNDCIVEVLPSFDGRSDHLTNELQESIRSAVGALELEKRRTLAFKLNSTAAGYEQVSSLFASASRPIIPETDDPNLLKLLQRNADSFKASPALLLAEELGFEKVAYSHSPNGGAPERLIGSRAPSFLLKQLDGTSIKLHNFIDKKPTLITFWGLACGPCRIEAPWLSKFHETYAEQGFAIIAVNACNDSSEDIAEYVDKEKLKHTIALDGKNVSNDQYHVGAYPTTFWVDRRGAIVDYEVGFTTPARLEAKIKEMLSEEIVPR